MERIIARRVIPKLKNNLKSLHPILQRIYLTRNVNSLDELIHKLKYLLPYYSLSNIDKAVMRLIKALKNQQHVMIIGDFDTDGATSTALSVRALRTFGLENVSYLIPNRFTYGYGLTPEIVTLASLHHPDLIITVDNGISSHDGVAHANHLGVDVIITDHHLQGETLPSAHAIVNPNCKGDFFPSKCLAGVGVAFYLMLALRAALKEINWFKQNSLEYPNMAKFLDFVALGTIADLVPLDKNNRILIQQGIRRIRAGSTHPGILALLKVSKRPCKTLRENDLGFGVAPRLNAAGRLDDMSVGVACLLANNIDTALDIAYRLDNLNKERRVIESQTKKEAFKIINSLNLNNELPLALCLYREEWHQGILGLVAAHIKERTHRPTIVFAKMNNSTLKGSARSVLGLHIRNVLEKIATKHPGLVINFGGHAMAAGLSLSIEHFDEFKKAFSQEVNEHLDKGNLQPRLISDGELTTHELTLELALLIHKAGPWGQDFPEPLFDGRFKLINQRIVRHSHLKLILQVPNSNYCLDGIFFHADLKKWPNFNCEYVYLAYRLDINEFQGRRKLQLLVEYIQAES